MTGLRPAESLSEPQTGETRAIIRTTTEMESPAVAGVTPNRRDRIGRNGCVT